jgi:hypothetical protein
MEQFIELFDPNLVDISMHPPEFLNIHYLLLVNKYININIILYFNIFNYIYRRKKKN